MPRQRRHRAPFVVTIASAATVSLAAACGGSTDSDLFPSSGGTGAQGGSGNTSGSGGSSGTGGTHPGCPSAFPAHGNPCALPTGTMCYFDQGPCCPDWQAECIEGAWSAYVSSCNPPPPDPCPASPPTHGEACGSKDMCGNPNQYCTYGTCADGSAATIAQCTGGTWTVDHANCTPPPCETLDPCSCFDRSDCKPLSDDCLCQCDYACPGDAPCDCVCGGGKYLGCAPVETHAG